MTCGIHREKDGSFDSFAKKTALPETFSRTTDMRSFLQPLGRPSQATRTVNAGTPPKYLLLALLLFGSPFLFAVLAFVFTSSSVADVRIHESIQALIVP
ncbi:hypothetical protein BT63DRAFT_168697 [Microthyrium microscopicum]|uniref:Uncharacterized protein n=1 Tax=Microthyrium microscopicum TaxID=703497 RepID=A0A6A6UQZ2_9PEZI|nr:hypothetical protein BT63DRAFT_168697 [Microthyrium microscopicum]